MEDLANSEMKSWLSSYGIITAERILGKFNIKLAPAELKASLQNASSFYSKLLQVPLKNVLNGIILQQGNDYQIYVQKLYIDYLLSGENNKEPDSQGAGTREALEEERKRLLVLGEAFNSRQKEHDTLIASTQKRLIHMTSEWRKAIESGVDVFSSKLTANKQSANKINIRKAIEQALIYSEISQDQSETSGLAFIDKVNEHLQIELSREIKESTVKEMIPFFTILYNFKDNLAELKDRVDALSVDAKNYREEFYNAILHTLELIRLLPEYKIDEAQDKINREPLYFDKALGGQ